MDMCPGKSIGTLPGCVGMGSEGSSKPSSMIVEKTWKTGEVPGGWKKRSIAAIFKKGILEDPGNYQPVSITSVP